MRRALVAFTVVALMLFAGSASAVTFLYEDFESGAPGWQHWTDDLWHLESYRSYGGSYSAAYNRGLYGYYDYDTGYANYGEMFSPVLNFPSATSIVMDFYSWLDTENGTGDFSYVFDNARVGIYTEDYIPLMHFDPDINFFDHQTWMHLVTPDLKPWFDSLGYSSYRMGFYFDTIDASFNDYEGWYIDDVTFSGDVGGPVVPEPSTLLLLGTGILGFGVVARRKFLG